METRLEERRATDQTAVFDGSENMLVCGETVVKEKLSLGEEICA